LRKGWGDVELDQPVQRTEKPWEQLEEHGVRPVAKGDANKTTFGK